VLEEGRSLAEQFGDPTMATRFATEIRRAETQAKSPD